MRIKPLPGFVVIQPSEGEATQGGIVLPESAKLRQPMGAVIAVSEHAPVAEGNVVYYVKQWTEPQIKLDGTTYEFVKFEDCRGVLE